MAEIEGLTLLGQANTEYPQHYTPQLLERFPNRYPQHEYAVELDCPEFTCLCPRSNFPDLRYRKTPSPEVCAKSSGRAASRLAQWLW